MVSYRCPDCRTPIGGNAVGEVVTCFACGNESEVPYRRPSLIRNLSILGFLLLGIVGTYITVFLMFDAAREKNPMAIVIGIALLLAGIIGFMLSIAMRKPN